MSAREAGGEPQDDKHGDEQRRELDADAPRRVGILEAIETFYDPEKRISLYVYSDDMAQGSIDSIVREVDRKNHANDPVGRPVRIHAVAFPVYYDVTGGDLVSAARFATLMRVLCQRNGGTCVALPSQRSR